MEPASTRRENETAHFQNTRLSDITRLLEAIQHGDPRAAEELLPLVYRSCANSPRTTGAIKDAGQL